MSLCNLGGFDLRLHNDLCPQDRSHLKDFFTEAKGKEWTDSDGWDDEYRHPCDVKGWHGVKCNATTRSVIELKLGKNGLSGKLSSSLGDLISLKILDLRDNNIKRSIPSEIGKLTNLVELDLCYNELVGEIPIGFKKITKNLERLLLQGNRLNGTIEGLQIQEDYKSDKQHASKFVADCGYPSELNEPIKCEECTMCCNSDGVCEETFSEEVHVLFPGLDGNGWKYVLAALLVVASCFILSLISSLAVKSTWPEENTNVVRSWLGVDSVYFLLLGEKWIGWMIAFVIVLAQLTTFYVFFRESYLDFENDNYLDNAWLYTWECTRDQPLCGKEIGERPLGWAVFGVLMAMHLSPDLVAGIKLIWVAPRMGCLSKILRCFAGGVILVITVLFALGVSLLFNFASAASNTDLIINAVILLFVNDFDELCFNVLHRISPNFLQTLDGYDSQAAMPDQQEILKGIDSGCNKEIEAMNNALEMLKGKTAKLDEEKKQMNKELQMLKRKNDEEKKQMNNELQMLKRMITNMDENKKRTRL